MISIRYPGMQQGFDPADAERSFDKAFAYGRDYRDEKGSLAAFEKYLGGMGGGQQVQQPMSLAALDPRAGMGGVERAPLPDIASGRVAQAHGLNGPVTRDIDVAGGSRMAPALDASQRVAQSFSDERSPFPGAAPKQDRLGHGSIFGRFMQTVRSGGVTNPAALAAIASTGKRESGFKEQNAYGEWSDPSQSGQPGQAGGIMSWRGPRLEALRQFAQQNGDNPNAPSPETQAKYLLAEDPSLIQKLQQARTPEEAQQLMNAAWRYAGYDQPGGETAARMQGARDFAQQFGGQAPMQVAQAQGGAPVPQEGMQGGGGLPDRATMLELFKYPQTRPLAIELAKSAQAAQQGDPEAALKLEKLKLEVDALRNPQGEYKVVGDQLVRIGADGQVSDATPGQSQPGSNEFRFGGKSVEAQALNGLMDSGQLTPAQAQQLGAGKTITGPNGEIIFMTPQGVFGQPAQGGQPVPLSPQPGAASAAPPAPGNIQITEPKVTIDEKKAMTFADRMSTSGKIIDEMGTRGSGKADKTLSGVWGVGEYLTSDDFKKVDQAKRDFINAQLRRESGAVISTEEFDNANKQYFPQPNDPPEVLEQKRRNRQIVIDGMVRDGGPTYKAPGGNSYKDKYGLD